MRLNITGVIDVSLRIVQHAGRLTNFFLALHCLRPDVKQGNLRFRQVEGMFGKDVAHNGKLRQIDGVALGVGTKVKHYVTAV